MFSSDLTGLIGGLTWQRLSDTQIVGKDGAVTIVTLDLSVAGSTATVTATLNDNYDSHPGINLDDLAALGTVNVVATDTDGDSALGAVNVSVSDDLPGAANYAHVPVVTEGAGATVLGVAATLLQVVSGADGIGPLSGVAFTNQGVTGGTLSVNASGELVYTPPASVSNVPGPVTETFSYTLTDGDGDTVTRTVTVQVADGANPSAGQPITLTLDDQNLADGSTPAGADTAQGSTTFTAGSDAIASIVFSSDLTGLIGGLTWQRLSDTQIVGKDGAVTIVTLDLSVAGSTATVTATLNDNYDSHPGINLDDLAALGTVNVVATDTDGDSALGAVNVSVSDDLPGAANYAHVPVVTEGAGATVLGVAATLLQVVSGADGIGPLSGVAFTNQGVTGGTLSVNVSGELVYTPPASVSNVPGPVTETFSYTLTDGDGDTVTRTVTVQVADGANPSAGEPITLTLDDQNLADGSTPAGADTAQGSITFTAGSDAIASIVFSSDLTGLIGGLTWQRLSDTQIVGKDGAVTIVTLDLSVAGSTATVTATLNDNYDSHPGINLDDLAALGTVNVVATDTDGDSALGAVNVSVSDDLPGASGASISVVEGVVTSGVLSFVQGADGATVTAVNSIPLVFNTTTGWSQGIVTAQGTLEVKADGSYRFTAQSDDVYVDGGLAAYTFTVTDGDGDTASAALNVTVTDDSDPVTATLTAVAGAPGPSGTVVTYTVTLSTLSGLSPIAPQTGQDLTFTLANNGPSGAITITIPAGSTSGFVDVTYPVGTTSVANALLGGVTNGGQYESLAVAGNVGFTLNTTPSVTGAIALTVNEAALDLPQTGNDLRAGATTGTNPGATTETAQATSGITFTAGANEGLTVAFATPTGGNTPTVSGLAAGYSISWAIVGGQLQGSLIQGGVTNLGVAIVLALSGVLAVGAGQTVTPTVTATLVDNLIHTTGNGSITIGNLRVEGTDTSGDKVSAAVTVTVQDDAPVLGSFDSGVIPNQVGSVNGEFVLNAGADGVTSFNITGPAISGITYTTSQVAGGTLLLAENSSGTDIFSLLVRTNGTYAFNLIAPATGTTQSFSIGNLPAGGPNWRQTTDGVIEFSSPGGINSNNNAFGVANPFVGANEGFTMEFHDPNTDLANVDDAPSTNPDFYDAVTLGVASVNGNGGTYNWVATNTLTNNVQSGTFTVTSSSTSVLIDPTISFNVLTITGSANVQGQGTSFSAVTLTRSIVPEDQVYNFSIQAVDADGDVSGTSTLNIKQIAQTGSTGFNMAGGTGDDVIASSSLNDTMAGGAGIDFADYSDQTTSVSINLDDSGNASTLAGTPTNPADGQVAGAAAGDSLSGIEGLMGGSGNDYLFGNSSANALMGGAGNDDLRGEGGADTLTGGSGADTLTGGAGADQFVIDPSHFSVAADDVIADYNLAEGDVVNLDALFDTLASRPTNAAEAESMVNISGNQLIVDLDGAGPGAGVQVATFLVAPVTPVAIIFDDQQPPANVT